MELRIHVVLGLALSLLLASIGQAAGKRPQVIKQFPLDERTVYEIPIGPDVPTTLMFPSALTAIEGANVSANPDTAAPVLLAYTPGRYFFSVRAADPNAKAAVNVVWKNRTFVLRFFVSKEPYASVTFYEDALAGRSASLHLVGVVAAHELFDQRPECRSVLCSFHGLLRMQAVQSPKPFRDVAVLPALRAAKSGGES